MMRQRFLSAGCQLSHMGSRAIGGTHVLCWTGACVAKEEGRRGHCGRAFSLAVLEGSP